MAYNFTYTGFPPPSNSRMMNPPPNIHGPPPNIHGPPPNIHGPPPPIFHNNNNPWRPPPERPQFNINSFMTPPHVMQRPNFPAQNMFTGCPVHQVQRPHFTPDNTFSQEASKGPQENFPFNNSGHGFQNNAQRFQGHHGRGRGFMRGNSRGQGFRGGFRGGSHNGNENGFNKTKKQKVDKRDLPENNVYFCDICDRGFKTEDKYQEHVDGHIKCSFKDCPFIAAPKLVQLHTRMQHSSGLAKQVWQVKSADDINKWREERKRNYPTADSVVRKKQEREDKIARGEVLHTKEFGKMRHGRGGNKRRGGRGRWRGRGRGRWRDYDNDGENEDYPQAVDGSDSEGPPEETIIRKSTKDDEVLGQSGAVSDSTGTVAEVNASTPTTELQAEVLSPQEPNMSLTLLTSYGESSPDSQLSDDNCEKSPVESDTKSVTQSTASPSKLTSPQKSTVTSSVGVLPPSAEPQHQATSQDVASTLEPSQSAVSICSVHSSSSPHKSVSQDASPSISSADPSAASPDSVPGQHQKHNKQSRGQNVRNHKENHGNKRAASSEQGSDPPHKKKKEQTKQPVHRYTLLEKLLAPDMRRERNKVLQCVHYIVKNNFFE